LQRPEDFKAWAAATPARFLFAVKGPRYITHMLKLRNVEAPLANFCANGMLALGSKLGPILWQFPASFRYDRERLEAFFELLPRDTEAAAKMARRHDHRVAGRVSFAIERKQRIRHAVEIRHDSFRSPDFIALLRRHRIGLVVADTVEWPLLMDLTADFVYVRLHGSEELYISGYDDTALRGWAKLVAAWARGADPKSAPHASTRSAPRRARRDVFVFFDNDAKVRAPVDAARLIALLSR
jgi:uncharacterized protein YecE (DUF72 family)